MRPIDVSVKVVGLVGIGAARSHLIPYSRCCCALTWRVFLWLQAIEEVVQQDPGSSLGITDIAMVGSRSLAYGCPACSACQSWATLNSIPSSGVLLDCAAGGA